MKGITAVVVLLVLILVSGIAYRFFGVDQAIKRSMAEQPKNVTITIRVGGEKMDFLKNPQVIDLLKSDYALTVNAQKTGSVEMVGMNTLGIDGMWPSSQVSLELFRTNGNTPVATENIFNSAVVAYASTEVADALVKSGIAQKREGTIYIVDCAKLFAMNERGETWASLGLSTINGRVKVYSSDPTQSNSGLMFAGLLANILNGGEVVTEADLPRVESRVVSYFRRLGMMDRSTSDLFGTFLANPKSKPIIIGYENQMTEYGLQHPQALELLKSQIRILYPIPTVWSSHPYIALTPNGKRLIEAMKDPRIQKLAWEQHGFRSGLMGVENDPKVLAVSGIPKTVDSIMEMPSARVVTHLLAALSADPTPTN